MSDLHLRRLHQGISMRLQQGLWGTIAGSRAVAGALSGVILDPPLGRLLQVASRRPPPPRELRLGKTSSYDNQAGAEVY